MSKLPLCLGPFGGPKRGGLYIMSEVALYVDGFL